MKRTLWIVLVSLFAALILVSGSALAQDGDGRAGGKIVVANRAGGTISVIDTAADTVLDTITVWLSDRLQAGR